MAKNKQQFLHSGLHVGKGGQPSVRNWLIKPGTGAGS